MNLKMSIKAYNESDVNNEYAYDFLFRSHIQTNKQN